MLILFLFRLRFFRLRLFWITEGIFGDYRLSWLSRLVVSERIFRNDLLLGRTVVAHSTSLHTYS